MLIALLVVVASVDWLLLARTHRIVALIVWVVLAANLVPAVDLMPMRLLGQIEYVDYLMLLLAIGALNAAFDESQAWRGVPRWLGVLCFISLVWWSMTLLRTLAWSGIPLSYGIAYGRDLVYLVVAAVLCCVFLARCEGRDLRLFAAGLTACASMYASAYTLTVLTEFDLSWLYHPYVDLSAYYSMPRLIAVGDVLVLPALSLSLWFALGRRGFERILWSGAFLILALEVLVQLTRAAYVGVFVALAVGFVVVMARREFAFLRRSAWFMVVVLIVVILAWSLMLSLSVSLGPTFESNSPVYQRLLSMGRDVGMGFGTPAGTVRARTQMADSMLEMLDGHWVWGLGFLHPRYNYVDQLPQGSIRNTEVGALGALMTVGAIGLGLILLLPLATIWWLLGMPPVADQLGLISIGMVGYCVALLATSVTLVILFGVGSAGTAGVFLGFAVAVGSRARDAAGDSTTALAVSLNPAGRSGEQ